MYRLIVNQDTHVLEDAQDIVEIILQSENYEGVILYNEFDPDDIYEENIDEFIEENDLSREPNLETLKEKGVLLYNWEAMEFDDNYTLSFYKYYFNEDYRRDGADMIKAIASQEDCYIGTVIIIEGGYSIIVDGRRLVNRDGYVVYKSKEKISDSEYYYV